MKKPQIKLPDMRDPPQLNSTLPKLSYPNLAAHGNSNNSAFSP